MEAGSGSRKNGHAQSFCPEGAGLGSTPRHDQDKEEPKFAVSPHSSPF